MGDLRGTELVAVSSVYDTLPVGAIGQPRFLNAVAELSTELEPEELLKELLAIEKECGRVRHGVWGPRTLDLDVLVYGEVVMNTAGLTLPHPRARGRAFVLVPLAEIAPDLVIPGGSETVSELVAALGDATGGVRQAGDAPVPA